MNNTSFEEIVLYTEEHAIHIVFELGKEQILDEAKRKGLPLVDRYSALYHHAHSQVGQDHIHVYAKNNKLFSLNKSGSAHDQSHGSRISNKVAKAINQYFPDITLPKNNIIETAPKAIQLLWVLQDK